jgi:PKD repeat protein
VKFSATDPAPQGPAPKNFDVDASGDRWAPDAVSLGAGDKITWHFGELANFPHDVWVIPPGGNPNPTGGDLVQVSPIVFPGASPVSKTFTQTGAWTFLCKVHAQFTGGAWSGMIGTATVAPSSGGDAPSGVDYTEYRVKTGDSQGDWVKSANTGGADPFASQVTISAEGQHTVEYRSVDKAGNVEATKSVSFGIDNPDPGFPVIEAFADPETGAAPLEVRFTASGFDPDGGSLSYKWEFADGSYLGRAVTRTYTKPGTYTARVTATDDEGDKTSKEVTVTVKAPGAEPPTVEASASVTSGAAPLPVQFTATGHDPDGKDSDLLYKWEFGDGGTSFAQSPSHTYATPGTFTAKVTVTDTFGAEATKTLTITVSEPTGNVAPSITDASGVPLTGTAPLAVRFTVEGSDPNKDPITFEWDFDDASPKGTGAEVEHTFTHSGTYKVKVTAKDSKGLTSAPSEVTVVVGDPPGNQAPSVQVTADPKTGTSPLTVQFSSQARDPDGDDLLYVWEFGDGGKAAGSTATHTYTTPGTYTATLTVRDPKGGQATASIQVTVTAPLAATVAPAAKSPAAAAPAPAPAAKAAPAPEQPAWFGVAKPATTTVATFIKRGLSVKVTCTEAMRGTATLKLSRKLAKQLGLKKVTLASRPVKCAGAGSKSVTLKPSAAVKRALKKAKGSVKVTLGVSLRTAGKSAKKSTRTITLARR